MPFTTKGRMAAISKDAQAAFEAGRTIFAYHVAATKITANGEIPDTADQIEAAESIGWHLEHVAARATGGLALIFRRS